MEIKKKSQENYYRSYIGLRTADWFTIQLHFILQSEESLARKAKTLLIQNGGASVINREMTIVRNGTPGIAWGWLSLELRQELFRTGSGMLNSDISFYISSWPLNFFRSSLTNNTNLGQLDKNLLWPETGQSLR